MPLYCRNIIRQATNSGGDDQVLFDLGATSGTTNNGGFGIASVEEHVRGIGLPIIVFADIRVDERRWPWPWMLRSENEGAESPGNIVVIDIPPTDDGAVDIEFLQAKLGKF